MKFFKAVNAVLLFLFCSFASVASADVIVYTESSQHKLFLSGGSTIHVRYSNGITLHSGSMGQDALTGANGGQVVVVEKLATYWVRSAYGAGRIRVTVPMEFYLTSWDVKALEKELERLGVKIKPKPLAKPEPKPGSVVSS